MCNPDHIAAVFILATLWAVIVGMIAYRLIAAYLEDGEGW